MPETRYTDANSNGARPVVPIANGGGNPTFNMGTNAPALSSTGTTSQQADQATNVTLLAANTGRKGAIIWNNSTSILYIKYGATATATDCTYKIDPDAIWEMPSACVYTGKIDGIWSADASGSARMTELT